MIQLEIYIIEKFGYSPANRSPVKITQSQSKQHCAGGTEHENKPQIQ